MSEHPVLDRLEKRQRATPTPSLLDAAIPTPRAEEKGPERHAAPSGPTPMRAPLPTQEVPTIGGFFAAQKALIDERRGHLDRMAILPQQAHALQMPDLEEMPAAPAVHGETLPPANTMDASGEKKERKTLSAPEGEVW